MVWHWLTDWDKLYEPLLKNARSKQNNRSSFQACRALQLTSPFFSSVVPHPTDISTLADKTNVPSQNVRQHPPSDCPTSQKEGDPTITNASYKHIEKQNKSILIYKRVLMWITDTHFCHNKCQQQLSGAVWIPDCRLLSWAVVTHGGPLVTQSLCPPFLLYLSQDSLPLVARQSSVQKVGSVGGWTFHCRTYCPFSQRQDWSVTWQKSMTYTSNLFWRLPCKLKAMHIKPCLNTT